MTDAPGVQVGKRLVVCDQCGSVYTNDQLGLQWNGLRCCRGAGTNGCWEPRHPQEYMRGKADKQAAPWSRPWMEGKDVSPGSGNEVKASDL